MVDEDATHTNIKNQQKGTNFLVISWVLFPSGDIDRGDFNVDSDRLKKQTRQ